MSMSLRTVPPFAVPHLKWISATWTLGPDVNSPKNRRCFVSPTYWPDFGVLTGGEAYLALQRSLPEPPQCREWTRTTPRAFLPVRAKRPETTTVAVSGG